MPRRVEECQSLIETQRTPREGSDDDPPLLDGHADPLIDAQLGVVKVTIPRVVASWSITRARLHIAC
jgi:hypothetical protein